MYKHLPSSIKLSCALAIVERLRKILAAAARHAARDQATTLRQRPLALSRPHARLCFATCYPMLYPALRGCQEKTHARRHLPLRCGSDSFFPRLPLLLGFKRCEGAEVTLRDISDSLHHGAVVGHKMFLGLGCRQLIVEIPLLFFELGRDAFFPTVVPNALHPSRSYRSRSRARVLCRLALMLSMQVRASCAVIIGLAMSAIALSP